MFGHISFAKNSTTTQVDATNYYSFEKTGAGIITNWLRESDAVPIIIDEHLKKGITYYTRSMGNLRRITESKRLVVTISFEKPEKKYGFIYEPGHNTPLNPKDIIFLTIPKKPDYIQIAKDIQCNTNYEENNPIPDNIFLAKETCYWFQYDITGTRCSVSKNITENILRQDIDNYLTILQP